MESLFAAQELESIRAYHDPFYRVAAVDLLLWPVLLVVSVRWLTRPLYAAGSQSRVER